MYGQILYGSSQYAGTQFGIYVVEVEANISQSTAGVSIRAGGTLTTYPSVRPRIPELDINVNVRRREEDFTPKLGIGIYGGFDEFGTEFLSQLGIGSYARFRVGEGFTGLTYLGIRATGNFSFAFVDDNSIAWSNIGSMDFTISQDNIAGKAPVAWKGYVYAIEQLAKGNVILVYGKNGITILQPSETSYGQKQISSLGLKNKQAIVNTMKEHYFILSNNFFYKITEEKKLVKLGYEEFMSTLTNPVLSFDNKNDLIYLCDGTNGYVYSIEDDALTKGPASITGLYYQDGTTYVVASADITAPIFNLETDVYDLGNRKEKTIFNLEIGTDYTGTILAAIEYRVNNTDSFMSSPWVVFNPNGFAELPCYGREYKFKIKATELATFTIDWLKVNGVIHGFSFLDTANQSITMK